MHARDKYTSKMVYIEPIQLEISTAGEQLSPTLEDEGSVEVPDWSETYNWALNKILSNSCNSITQDDISGAIDSALTDLYSPINNVEEEFADFLKERANRAHPRRSSNVVLYENNAVILPSEQQGQLYAISEHESGVTSIIDSFEERMEDFSNIASDFGLDVDILSGREFAESMSENINSEVVSRDDFDNTAEEAVYSEITERLTKSIDSNITLRFGNDDPEVFEYDLLLHTGRSNRVVIEVKDASREEADLNKNDLIDVPRDKTNIIKSGRGDEPLPFRHRERNEIFVVVKHMDKEDFNDQKQKASRREINLLRYEDGNYIEELESKFRELVYFEL